MRKPILLAAVALLTLSCHSQADFDATGTFEATEVTLSAEASGRILHFDVTQGARVEAGSVIGAIDSVQLYLQREQLILQQRALLKTKPNVETQVAALRQQIEKQEQEMRRVENLLKDNAATQKQFDDLKAQYNITCSQLEATLATLGNSNASIDQNAAALELQRRQLDDLLQKCRITSPITGTVLVKFMEAGELAGQGRPLLKLANLDQMYLRAYFTSDQLARLSLGQKVTVVADFGGSQQRKYEGTVAWIAQQSEFTPRGIQTRNTRANLVYAVKIAVPNDGFLKIGLYGEVIL